MQLLGKYSSNISEFLYTQLLALFQTSISAGESGGVSNVTQADLQAIANQATNNTAVPLASAGQKTNDAQFNYPISVLQAKYGAIQSEISSFVANSEALLAKLQLQVDLLDKILAQAELNYWQGTIFNIDGSTMFSWDFNKGIGNVSTNIPASNPATSAVYTPNTNIKTVFNTNSGLRSGLASPSLDSLVQPVNLTWTFSTQGQNQEVYTNNSAQLSILEDQVKITYLPNPNVSVNLPVNGSIDGVFTVSGDTSQGPINTYIRTGFNPRTTTVSVIPSNGVDSTFESWNCTVAGSSTPIGPYITAGNLNVTGTVTSLPITDGLGHQYLIASGQTIYIETQVLGISGGAQMHVFLDCYSAAGNLIQSIALANPTGNSAVYTWYQELVLPTNSAFRTAQLRYVTTDTSWTISKPRVHTPILLSSYNINDDSVYCYTLNSSGFPNSVYNSDTYYNVDENGLLTFFNIPDGIALSVTFQEDFPYYQCSLNQINWSPIIMLDPERPYPDTGEILQIVRVINGQFPITNEEGIHTGLYLSMVGVPLYNYQFIVGVNAVPTWGETATLVVNLASTSFINQINIKPFSNFFPKLTGVVIQGFDSSNKTTVWTGEQEINSETRIEFTKILAGTVYLTFRQEGYTAKDYQLTDSNYIRRSVMQQIQNILPAQAQTTVSANYIELTGFEYDFGIENIYGVLTAPTVGVSISGPYRFTGQPKVVTLNTVNTGTVNQYICYSVTNVDGSVPDFNTTGFALTNGQSLVIPYASGVVLDSIAYVDFYVKHVLTTSDASVTRFALQVNDNV